jgi:hypothetical protein
MSDDEDWTDLFKHEESHNNYARDCKWCEGDAAYPVLGTRRYFDRLRCSRSFDKTDNVAGDRSERCILRWKVAMPLFGSNVLRRIDGIACDKANYQELSVTAVFILTDWLG